MDELIKRLREFAGSRFITDDVLAAGALIEQQAARIAALELQVSGERGQKEIWEARAKEWCENATALIEGNDSLRKSLTAECEARCALEDEVKALRKDAERWRTEMQLRDNPAVAIFFYGNEGRCSIHRNSVVIAQGDTYAKAIDAAVALSAASDGGKS